MPSSITTVGNQHYTLQLPLQDHPQFALFDEHPFVYLVSDPSVETPRRVFGRFELCGDEWHGVDVCNHGRVYSAITGKRIRMPYRALVNMYIIAIIIDLGLLVWNFMNDGDRIPVWLTIALVVSLVSAICGAIRYWKSVDSTKGGECYGL